MTNVQILASLQESLRAGEWVSVTRHHYVRASPTDWLVLTCDPGWTLTWSSPRSYVWLQLHLSSTPWSSP